MDALLETIRAFTKATGVTFTETSELIEDLEALGADLREKTESDGVCAAPLPSWTALAAMRIQWKKEQLSDRDVCLLLFALSLCLQSEVDCLEQRCSSLEAALEVALGKEPA